MAYTMSQREIDLRKMAQAKAARLNSAPRMKEDMSRTVEAPAPAVAAKPKSAAKKKKTAKNSRKRGSANRS